jgi:hypothetical protein
MSRMSWPVCAVGVGLLFLAGCGAMQSFSILGVQSSNGDLVLAGSAESVSQSAQSALSRLGLVAMTSRSGSEIHIVSKTPQGARFALVLVEDRSKWAPRTRVRVDWQDGKDDAFAVQLFAELTGRAGADGAHK